MTTPAEPQHKNPPGYASIELNAKALRGIYAGRTKATRAKRLEHQREQGVMIYGTPDSVASQIRRFFDLVGGFDHLLVMQQVGCLSHEWTVASVKRFARDVYPTICHPPHTRPLQMMGMEN